MHGLISLNFTTGPVTYILSIMIIFNITIIIMLSSSYSRIAVPVEVPLYHAVVSDQVCLLLEDDTVLRNYVTARVHAQHIFSPAPRNTRAQHAIDLPFIDSETYPTRRDTLVELSLYVVAAAVVPQVAPYVEVFDATSFYRSWGLNLTLTCQPA